MKFPFQIKEPADLDVVGFGTNAVDHIIQVPNYPEFNSKIEFVHHEKSAGGEVATTLAGLQRLGLRTAYAGRFGDDAEGDLGLKTLIDEGVDVTYAERVAGAATQTAFIIVDKKTGERTIIWHRDKRLAYGPQEAPLDAALRCKVLHMTAHDTAACMRMAAKAKENGAIVSVDIDRVPDGLNGLLPLVDVLITSSEFPARFTGIADHRSALCSIRDEYGCAVVGSTRGKLGSIVFCEGVFTETDGFEVPGGCVDTTGAGDAFRTGFLYGLLTGESVEESARFANAVAALKCRTFGARSGLPTQEELVAFTRKT
jgi:sugar/nucleoside kinase (ribokinase family)